MQVYLLFLEEIVSMHKRTSYLVLLLVLVGAAIGYAGNNPADSKDWHLYQQDRKRITEYKKTFNCQRYQNKIDKYKLFADSLKEKWESKDKECYGRLMVEICGPLSSGTFPGYDRYEEARKYALGALKYREQMSLYAELELVKHVMTLMSSKYAPKGQKFAKARTKDVEVRLHALKRIRDSIDPNWDPNEVIYINIPFDFTEEEMKEQGFWMSGMSASAIKNPKVRVRYIEAYNKNAEKARKHSEQHKLRKWLKYHSPRTEEYIIKAYSRPPFDNAELLKYLNDYKVDEKTKLRIVNAVAKNTGIEIAIPTEVHPKKIEPERVLSWIRFLADRFPVDLEKGDSISKWWSFEDGTVYKYRITKSTWDRNKELIGTEFTVRFEKLKRGDHQLYPHKYSLQVEGFDKWPYKELVVRKNRIFVTDEYDIENPLIVFPLFKDMVYWDEKQEYDFIMKAIKYEYATGLYAPVTVSLWSVDHDAENHYSIRQMLNRGLYFEFEKGKGITKWLIPGGLELELVE